MKHPLRSAVTTTGRRMAGARSLWRANGMREEQFDRPIIGIANSFTQLVPGHVHLHEIGQQVKQRIEACGCFAAEFDTIAVDDGIAMGHDGMLYSLPSTASNTWPTPIASTHWCASAIATRSHPGC